MGMLDNDLMFDVGSRQTITLTGDSRNYFKVLPGGVQLNVSPQHKEPGSGQEYNNSELASDDLIAYFRMEEFAGNAAYTELTANTKRSMSFSFILAGSTAEPTDNDAAWNRLSQEVGGLIYPTKIFCNSVCVYQPIDLWEFTPGDTVFLNVPRLDKFWDGRVMQTPKYLVAIAHIRAELLTAICRFMFKVTAGLTTRGNIPFRARTPFHV